MISNKLTFPLVSLMTVLLFAFISTAVEAAPAFYRSAAHTTGEEITEGAFTAYQGDDQAGIQLYPHDPDGDVTLSIESKPTPIGEFSISQDIENVTILFLKNVPTAAVLRLLLWRITR